MTIQATDLQILPEDAASRERSHDGFCINCNCWMQDAHARHCQGLLAAAMPPKYDLNAIERPCPFCHSNTVYGAHETLTRFLSVKDYGADSPEEVYDGDE